jgi:PAS domain S-box-containing protein
MGSHNNKGISIFLRILLLFMLVNIATSGILIFISYAFSSRSIEKRTKENIAQQIATLRDKFEKQYSIDPKRTIHALASSSLLDDYLFASDGEKLILGRKIERLFLQTIKDFESYYSIRFVDSTGEVKISVAGELRRKESLNFKHQDVSLDDHASPPSLRASIRLFRRLESIPLLLSSGYMEWFMPPREPQIEGPFLAEDGTVTSLVGLSKLDLDSGTFGGVLIIRQNLDAFFASLREVKFFDENPVWVFDAAGHVLQRPRNDQAVFDPRADLPQGFQATFRLLDTPKGLVAFQDFSIVPGKTFIRVAVSLSSSLLFKDLTPAIQFFSLTLLGSLCVVFLVALYVSRYLARPIVELAAAAARLARGDLSTQVTIRATGEVQTLVDSFNRMTADLRQTMASRDASVESLVKEVAERIQANADLAREITERQRVEEALRENEERYRALVENTCDPVCELTPDGHYVYLSPTVRDVLGYEPRTLLGHSMFTWVHPDDQPAVSVICRQPAGQVTFRFQHRDGAWRWLESRGKGYRTASGELRTVMVSRDITERKRIEEALALKDRAIASTSEGIVITDPRQPDDPIIYVNSGFERLTGYSAAEALGRNARFLQGPDTDAAVVAQIRTARSAERGCTVELLNYRKDGTPFWNRLSLTPVRAVDGRVTHCIGVQSDITAGKEVERLKNDLVATVSHELRTPLTSLRGFAELLLKRDFPPPKQREFVTIMHQEAVRLTTLINDFLDLQRIEAGRQTYTFAPIDLGVLIRDAVPVFTGADETHSLCLAIPDLLPSVRADADRIRQVLANLLSNAMKYSPQGGTVTVGACWRGAAVEVRVADQGIGMTPENVQQLFTKFYRIDNAATRTIGGTGLGLALVKAIVEAHGGQVRVESAIGQGSTFFFTLPIADQAPQAVLSAAEFGA